MGSLSCCGPHRGFELQRLPAERLEPWICRAAAGRSAVGRGGLNRGGVRTVIFSSGRSSRWKFELRALAAAAGRTEGGLNRGLFEAWTVGCRGCRWPARGAGIGARACWAWGWGSGGGGLEPRGSSNRHFFQLTAAPAGASNYGLFRLPRAASLVLAPLGSLPSAKRAAWDEEGTRKNWAAFPPSEGAHSKGFFGWGTL